MQGLSILFKEFGFQELKRFPALTWVNAQTLSFVKKDTMYEFSLSSNKISKICYFPARSEVIKYDKTHKKNVRLTKRNIYIRDGNICQYSGKTLSDGESDIDHITPRSKGGKNSWANMVLNLFDLSSHCP